MDAILVFGSTKEEHDTRLNQILDWIKESGLKFNKDKYVIRQKKGQYFGHVITKQRIKPSSEKIEAIRRFHPLQMSVN